MCGRGVVVVVGAGRWGEGVIRESTMECRHRAGGDGTRPTPSPALLRQENPKMDASAATHEHMRDPDIKGHNVMTFVSHSACNSDIDLSRQYKKKNNAPKIIRGIHRLTATKKLGKLMLLLSWRRAAPANCKWPSTRAASQDAEPARSSCNKGRPRGGANLHRVRLGS